MYENFPREVTLFTDSQRWYHNHILHFMFIFIITGLPLVSHSFSWLAYLFGVPFSFFSGEMLKEEIVASGIQVCRIIHRFTAVLWILLSIPFVIKMLPSIRRWDITPHRKPAQSWAAYIKEGLKDTKKVYVDFEYPDHMGKYNILQMAAAWAVIAVCILMIISGIILWFRPWFSPGLDALMRTLHLAGFAFIVIFLIVHIYLAVHPINRAGYKAMFRTGTDSCDHARKKHPGMFES